MSARFYDNRRKKNISADLVHAVRGHIVVQLFAVLLLLALDMAEHLAGLHVAELEYAGVVEIGREFLSAEKVGAEIIIVVLFRRVGKAVGLGKLLFLLL